MTKTKYNWMVYLLVLLAVAPLVSAWGGPPPAEIVYYGYAYINGSAAPNGTQIQIFANGGALNMDNDTVITSGYFPGLQMKWDDPDTGTDEGITYGDNLENIYFKIGSLATTYPVYITTNTSQAGKSILINLYYLYNFPPVLDFISDQNFTEDVNTCFNLTASDNNSFRNDTLSYSDNAPGTLTKINNTLAQFCWTPTNSNVGNHTYTFTVTDDGSPVESDSQNVTIEVINVNDAPYINLADKVAFVNQTFTYNVAAVSGDIDPTGDTLNFTDNSTLFDINLTSGLISFVPNATGVYSIQITVCDNYGACTSDTFTLTIISEEKVVIRKNIEYLTTSGGLVYQITNKIYNFLGSDIVNANFTDSDIGFNGTVNITNERSIEITGNITVPESSSTFTFAQASLLQGAAVYYSNQPSILPAASTSCGTCGSGGECECPDCPTQCPVCTPDRKVLICHNGQEINVSCASLPSHFEHGDTLGPCPEVEELVELPEVVAKPRFFMQIIVWKYTWIILGIILLLLLLFILRLWLLKRRVKKFLKFVVRKKNIFHFTYGEDKLAWRLDDAEKLLGAMYLKKDEKEFMAKVKAKNFFSRLGCGWKAAFKIKQDPFETAFIISRIKKAIAF